MNATTNGCLIGGVGDGVGAAAADGDQIVLHATTAATFGLNIGSGGGVSVGGSSAGVVGGTAHFVDGLLNMRVVSVEALHDLVDLEDLQHANTFVTYVQHSAVVEQLNASGGGGVGNCVSDRVCNKRQRRQQLFKISNRMTALLSRFTANLNCYNNAQRHSRHQPQQQQQQQQHQQQDDEVRVLPPTSEQRQQQH